MGDTNKNNSILLEVMASVFIVSSNFPDNPRTCISSNVIIVIHSANT